MSDKDNNPADKAVPVTVVTFYDDASKRVADKDFRPLVLPADAEEETGPKAVPATEPVDSQESPSETEQKSPVTPAPAPAPKAPSKPKVPAPGTPSS